MITRSQASKEEGSETRAQARRRQVASKRPAPRWGEEIVRTARKRAAVLNAFEGNWRVRRNGCWEWSKGTSHGYGLLWLEDGLGRIPVYAHRIAYVLANGPIPLEPNGWRSMSVCHTCDNPICVNPKHLFIGTQADNMRDMAKKGRSCNGKKNARTKVTDTIVRQIRQLATQGKRQYKIAEKFGLSEAQVSRIIRGIRRQTAKGKIRKRHGNWKHGKYSARRSK